MTSPPEGAMRSYGCSYGCGNPYDYVFVSVADSTTEFLCTPCFIQLALTIVEAVTEGVPDEVMRTLKGVALAGQMDLHRSSVKARGHNAPANTLDPDVLAAYDDVVTADELPEEFR